MTVSLGAIDDDLSILYTLEAMAGSRGWTIHTSTHWKEALEWVRRKEVDILLVDYHMPEMGGEEVIRRSRELSRELVILALTVEEDPDLARDLLLAGADDFITKPIRLADFTARIALHARLAEYRRMPGMENHAKGIHQKTLRTVLAALDGSGEARRSVQDVAEKTGLAYQTAHRYLEYLTSTGIAYKEPVYSDGRPGRPKHVYGLSKNHDPS